MRSPPRNSLMVSIDTKNDADILGQPTPAGSASRPTLWLIHHRRPRMNIFQQALPTEGTYIHPPNSISRSIRSLASTLDCCRISFQFRVSCVLIYKHVTQWGVQCLRDQGNGSAYSWPH